MRRYSEAARERVMKVREVIWRAMVKRIIWWQAAEILGISNRSLRCWKRRYEQHGYKGLFDRRRQRKAGTGQIICYKNRTSSHAKNRSRSHRMALVEDPASGGSEITLVLFLKPPAR